MDKINFARLVMKLSQWDMRYLEQHELIELEQLVRPPLVPVEKSNTVEPKAIDELMLNLRSGRRIEAIKAYRNLTGVGLIDAKNWVETNIDYVVKQK